MRRLRPVAVVLDVGLPSMDGIEVCRTLRDSGDWTPVLFVTARDDEVDRVLGLELGADDYVTKPFSPRELVARVRAVLRRGTPASEVLEVGRTRIDLTQRRAWADGVEVPLTSMEFDLLAQLMRRPRQVFERAQLLSAVWGYRDRHQNGGRARRAAARQAGRGKPDPHRPRRRLRRRPDMSRHGEGAAEPLRSARLARQAVARGCREGAPDDGERPEGAPCGMGRRREGAPRGASWGGVDGSAGRVSRAARSTLWVRATAFGLAVAGVMAVVAGMVSVRLVSTAARDVTRETLADQADVVAAQLE